MKPIICCSDLHLDATRPWVTRAFTTLLERWTTQAQGLYILGDLFEVWVGDDDDDELAGRVRLALKSTSARIPVGVMLGNRDFLLGARFAAETGCVLLDDPHPIEAYGRRALLMHGDTLCTDDVAYQNLRRTVRDAHWQQNMLAKTLQERRQFAQSLRSHSKAANANKAENIMDVSAVAVAEVMAAQGADLLIHGHTHRPGVHSLPAKSSAGGFSPTSALADATAAITSQRWVLGDWDSHAWWLRWSNEGINLECEAIRPDD